MSEDAVRTYTIEDDNLRVQLAAEGNAEYGKETWLEIEANGVGMCNGYITFNSFSQLKEFSSRLDNLVKQYEKQINGNS